jgi:hypothetical protein
VGDFQKLTTQAAVAMEGRKSHWSPGERAWFEYHCFESMDSEDADMWLRSHQRVEVLREGEWEKEWGEGKTIQDRMEAGMPKTYRIRFSDGHEGTAFEDELYTTPEHWHRDDPPSDRLDQLKPS